MKRTKIVCTLGPTSDKVPVIKKLIKAGLNVARLNFSHNVHEYHGQVMKNIRTAAKALKTNVAILQDLQGPRIRLGKLPEKGIAIKRGDKVVLTTEKYTSPKKISVTYAEMHKDMKPGERILIADGLFELKVLSVKGRDMHCEVVNGGTLTSNKGMNLPDTKVTVPAISEKDKEDLVFGVKSGVDFVALSFVRSAADVHALRKLIEKAEKSLGIKKDVSIKIIVKVERREAVENIEGIIEAADGIMVARGDLGIELPAEDVPLIQKAIIDKCLKAAKPVIVATQMLESMVNNPRPTRAEVSDIANAVIDHADAVMLSGETANGKFPVEAVTYMRKTIEAVEASAYDNLVVKNKTEAFKAVDEAMSKAAKLIADETSAELIFCATMTGRTARFISRYRPERTIFAATENERVLRQLCLTWGVYPFILSESKTFEQLVTKGRNYLLKNKFVKKGNEIIVIGGIPVRKPGMMNVVEVQTV